MVKQGQVLAILQVLFIILFIGSTGCRKQASFEEILKSIETYKEGQSRQQLSEIEILVQQAIPSQHKSSEMEKQMNVFLQSQATLESKQFICRQLTLIGTGYSIPVLSNMLYDIKTAEMARYAMEQLPGDKVDAALRDALPKVEDNTKVGIINTLGLRRNDISVTILGQILQEADPKLAPVAASALGEIANGQAVKILTQESLKHKDRLKEDILHALLSAAAISMAREKAEEASAIYGNIYTRTETLTIRAGALRGILISNPNEAGQRILGILNSDDVAMQIVAIQTLNELTSVGNIQQIAEKLSALSPQVQIQLITVFSTRQDMSVRNEIIKALKMNDRDVRLAAIQALGKLGDETTISMLVNAAVNGNRDEISAARESLAKLRGNHVDEKFISYLSEVEPVSQIEIINVINARRIYGAEQTVFSYLKNPEPEVRIAAIKCLGTIASRELVPQLLTILLETKSSTESAALEQSTVDIMRRNSESTQVARPIMDRYAKTENTDQKTILMKVLGKLRDPASLTLILDELKKDNSEIQYAAIQALNNWQAEEFKNDLILEELITIVRGSGDEKNRILALRGFLHLTAIISRNNPDKALQKYRNAEKYAAQVNEKQMILSGLQTIKSIEALQMSAVYLKDSVLVEEAEVTTLKLAVDLIAEHSDEVKETLDQIIKTSKNNQHIKQAKEILIR